MQSETQFTPLHSTPLHFNINIKFVPNPSVRKNPFVRKDKRKHEEYPKIIF
jgi:hypothetical protein